MLDFWAKGADGVTVRLVTLFVVVFKMAGGLPSLALVATGEELRNVFMVAVLLQAPAGLPSLYERGCRRVSLAGWALRRRSGGAPSVGCRRVLRARRIRRGTSSRALAAGGFRRLRAAVSQRTAGRRRQHALDFFL